MPMRQLLLLRHAKSSWAMSQGAHTLGAHTLGANTLGANAPATNTPGTNTSGNSRALPDRDRPLSPRGRRAASLMRAAMRELGLAPDMVLLSPSRRTRETLDALEPWDDAPLVEPVDTLYLATVPQLLDVLHGVPETVRSVLLIGHNPGMHELALLLVGSRGTAAQGDRSERAIEQLAGGYPTGALAEFGIAGPWWQLGTGGGQLVRFLRPRDLGADGPGNGPGNGPGHDPGHDPGDDAEAAED
jgi:phosphohistidine phosphatase